MSRKDKYVKEARKMFHQMLGDGYTKKESFDATIKYILNKVFEDMDNDKNI